MKRSNDEPIDWPHVEQSSLREWSDELRFEINRLAGRGAERPVSLLAWGRELLPAHFRRPPSKMHHWLARELDTWGVQRGAKLNIVGPRGGAKSTLVTLAYVLRAALEGGEPYVWIVSDTLDQAAAHLENLKLELVENEQLAARYGLAARQGPVWRAGAVQLAGGATIEAFGTGQRIRGRRHRAHRPTLIVCDDLQNDSHMRSATQRENSRRWFQGTLLKAGTKGTNIINLATALHRDALALELTRTPGWTSRTFAAIERWPDDLELWQQWEAIYCGLENPAHRQDAQDFYNLRRSEMDAGAELLWPEEEDLYTLMCLRVEGGRTAFEREKQGSPANPELYEWPEEYFDAQLGFAEWPPDLTLKVVALDPSKGNDARHGDYSAFVLLGIDAAGVLYVEADLARRPTPQMVADGAEICRRFRPAAFALEANQYQELLGAEFAAEFQRQGLWDLQPWTIDNRVNKQVRIRRLAPYLSARRLRFKAMSRSTALLIDQLREFPIGDHDDGPDALEMALRLATALCAGPADDGLGDRLLR